MAQRNLQIVSVGLFYDPDTQMFQQRVEYFDKAIPNIMHTAAISAARADYPLADRTITDALAVFVDPTDTFTLNGGAPIAGGSGS